MLCVTVLSSLLRVAVQLDSRRGQATEEPACEGLLHSQRISDQPDEPAAQPGHQQGAVPALHRLREGTFASFGPYGRSRLCWFVHVLLMSSADRSVFFPMTLSTLQGLFVCDMRYLLMWSVFSSIFIHVVFVWGLRVFILLSKMLTK